MKTGKTAAKAAKQTGKRFEGRKAVQAHQRNGKSVAITENVRAAIIADYEENGPGAQMREWFRKHPDVSDWAGVIPIRLNVGLHNSEWAELMQIARDNDWTMEEAVDELLYIGLQRYPMEQMREERNAEYHNDGKAVAK